MVDGDNGGWVVEWWMVMVVDNDSDNGGWW